MAIRPVSDGLFTWPSDEPQLIGSSCDACGTVSFPAQASCPRCTGTDVRERLLSREGTLWTWTVQGFRPKSPPYAGPAEFEPYPVGYVELPGEVKVETRLVDVRPDELAIGMPMELAIVPFTPATGDPVLMFAFRPRGATPYMHEHGISKEVLAKVAAKAFRNGAKNENAWRRTPMSEDQILDATMIADPLTQYMFCSPAEGAVALVLTTAERAASFTTRPVYLRSAVLTSRPFGSFEVFTPALADERGDSPSVAAAARAFEMAGVAPGDIDVVQVQDTESGAEIMHLAECGLCADGEQEDLVRSGATEIGGALPVNTDGGCLANGEPIGASGLRQVHESVVQLRGDAGERQVPGDPRTAFTHIYGAPGISACTVLTR